MDAFHCPHCGSSEVSASRESRFDPWQLRCFRCQADLPLDILTGGEIPQDGYRLRVVGADLSGVTW